MAPIDSQTLRRVIREVLLEELGRSTDGAGAFAATRPTPQIREEAVAIRSNTELMEFVHRLLEITKDGRARQEIETGRWVFRLAHGRGDTPDLQTRPPDSQSKANEAIQFDRGLVSERQIDAIPKGTTRLVLGKRARLTPLARDRLRQHGIQIERMG